MLQGFDCLYLWLRPGEVFQNVNHLKKEVWQVSRYKYRRISSLTLLLLHQHTCSQEKYPWTCSIALIRWSVKTHFRTNKNYSFNIILCCLFNNHNRPNWSQLPLQNRRDDLYYTANINYTFLISSKTISKDFLSIISVDALITVLITNSSYSISTTTLHSPADGILHAVVLLHLFTASIFEFINFLQIIYPFSETRIISESFSRYNRRLAVSLSSGWHHDMRNNNSPVLNPHTLLKCTILHIYACLLSCLHDCKFCWRDWRS